LNIKYYYIINTINKDLFFTNYFIADEIFFYELPLFYVTNTNIKNINIFIFFKTFY